ncbi:hypothetical protein ACE1CI_35710 [Aerosakkonemataceae cyanobacterium BLCC-F50]|uniref:Cardiolipin synthase N-terminal domain-containing protein n=1 Tax=Floridaenema flaviceps BLCC-F50 TaxID=3153642 RepID=A0ABV4Y3I8_9CYAN
MVPASILLALLIAGFLWYRILAKMGFKESALWVLLIMLFFPVTVLISFIYLALFPWPIQKELKQVKAKLSTQPFSGQPVDEIDIELERMRGDMGLNQMKKRKREN